MKLSISFLMVQPKKKEIPFITSKYLIITGFLVVLSLFLNACSPITNVGNGDGNDVGSSSIKNPVIYEVTSNTIGNATFYVFGSIHQGYSDAPYVFPNELMEKYNESTNVVFEADVSLPSHTLAIAYTQEINRNLLLNKGDARGSVLSGYIGAVNWERLLQIFNNESISSSKIDFSKKSVPVYSIRLIDNAYTQSLMSLPVPRVLINRNAAALSVSGAYGVDITFLDLAKTEGKTVAFLETPNEQYASQFAVDLDEQIDTLKAYVDKYYGIGLDACFVKGFSIESYLSQDMAVFNGLAASNKICIPSYYEKVLVDRNDNWIVKFRQFMATDKTYFIIVGILHLSGEDSLITKMQASDDFTVIKL